MGTRLAAAIATGVAVLAAACGGSTGIDSNSQPPSATSTEQSQDPTSVPTQPQSTTATVAPTIEPRTDGLAGAPIPSLSLDSSDFDESRFNARGGSFPSLDNPSIVPAAEAIWLTPKSLVLGAVQNGEARAYPIGMMTFHHVSNDTLGGEPYLVTF